MQDEPPPGAEVFQVRGSAIAFAEACGLPWARIRASVPEELLAGRTKIMVGRGSGLSPKLLQEALLQPKIDTTLEAEDSVPLRKTPAAGAAGENQEGFTDIRAALQVMWGRAPPQPQPPSATRGAAAPAARAQLSQPDAAATARASGPTAVASGVIAAPSTRQPDRQHVAAGPVTEATEDDARSPRTPLIARRSNGVAPEATEGTPRAQGSGGAVSGRFFGHRRRRSSVTPEQVSRKMPSHAAADMADEMQMGNSVICTPNH